MCICILICEKNNVYDYIKYYIVVYIFKFNMFNYVLYSVFM